MIDPTTDIHPFRRDVMHEQDYALAQTQATQLEVSKVLRNTYGLLALTLAFSGLVAYVAMQMNAVYPNIFVVLIAFYGLFFATVKLRNSGWGLVTTFALTGFMGYTLGPVLAKHLALPGGAQTIALALGATGATFLALSAWVLASRRDFSFMGGFLFAGMVIALLAGLGAVFLQLPALSLAVSAMVALLSAGMILFETSRIVNGGETNYVLATVGLFVSLFNLFTSLLSLFGFGSND